MSTKINLIHTSCKKCVFAKYDGITQVGCSLSLIDKYKQKNVEILEVYDKKKEFYVINNKKCYGYKEDKYFETRNISKLSIEDKVEYIKKTFKVNYLAVINIKKFTLQQINEILETLTECEIPPKKIILVRYQQDKDAYHFDNLKHILDKNKPKEWRVQSILDENTDFLSVLHQATNINKNNFVLSINGNYDKLCEIITYSQDLIYNHFGNFVVLSNESKETFFYNRAVYKNSFANGKDILADTNEYTVL